MLRDYQLNTITQLRSLSAKYRKIAVQLPTGAGKSVIIHKIIDKAHRRGKKTLVIVRRRQIVHQLARRFDAQIIMGQMKYDPDAKNLVASIDTLYKRNKIPDVELVIVDECHDAQGQQYISTLNKYPVLTIGFTATLWPLGNKSHEFWDTAIAPTTTKKLIEDKYLVPAKVLALANPDLSKVKKFQGDYSQKAVAKIMENNQIVSNTIKHYKKFANNKTAIAFTVDVNHSLKICQKFNSHGIPAAHLDANSPQKLRDETIKKLDKGEIKIITNCNILSTGFDLPSVQAAILLRPTASQILYIQQIGRVLRPHTNKDHATILDLAGNTGRHGHPHRHRPPDLKPIKKNKKIKYDILQIKTCQKCYYANPVTAKTCENCQAELKTERVLQEINGELVLIPEEMSDKYRILKRYRQLQTTEKILNRHPYWKYMELARHFEPSEIVKHIQVPLWVLNKLQL